MKILTAIGVSGREIVRVCRKPGAFGSVIAADFDALFVALGIPGDPRVS